MVDFKNFRYSGARASRSRHNYSRRSRSLRRQNSPPRNHQKSRHNSPSRNISSKAKNRVRSYSASYSDFTDAGDDAKSKTKNRPQRSPVVLRIFLQNFGDESQFWWIMATFLVVSGRAVLAAEGSRSSRIIMAATTRPRAWVTKIFEINHF